MREWTRGELQAFGAASNVLLLLGGIVLLALFYLVDISDFSYVEGLVALGAGAVTGVGIAIRVYLLRTGRSTSPFGRPGR